MSKQPFIEQLNDAIGRILADPDVQLSSVDASLSELVQLARDLRELPSPDFKGRLKADLERKTFMSTKTVTLRPDFRTVTPYLLPPNAEFIDFLKSVFGAEETEHTETGPGRFHSELKIGDSMVMVGVGSGRSMPTALHVYVPDVDNVYKRALDAGAVELAGIIEDHGDRFGCVQDPAGNHWYISTHLGASHVPENLHTITTYLHPSGASRFIDFVKRAFGGQEIARYDSPSGEVLHAKIGIGESAIEVSEPHGWWQSMPSMIYLYVPDVDSMYDQAIRAGATSLSAPANQWYGDRSAGVQDEWGNQWYMATPA